MELNDRKERLSLAYVGVVAAYAGYKLVEPPPPDKDSIDGILLSQEGRRPRIEFQAKASSQKLLTDTHIAFPLPVKNYDDLRADTITSRLLVVMMLPSREASWMIQSDKELRLRRCGYWVSLAGRPTSPNTSTVTVHIPRTQVFGSSQLRELMLRAEQGVPL
jgi:hypothetical protein